MPDLSRLAIHTITNKPWSLAECIYAYKKIGIPALSVWRNVIEPLGAKEAGQMLRDSGLKVPALIRGGFFTSTDASVRQATLDDNRRCIDEACEIGAEMVVLVVGATPGLALAEARKQVADSIHSILPHAQAANVKLAIEPLHPMYAADRSCINRIKEARQICEQLHHSMLGIALDVYHTWWDPDLEQEIAHASRQKTLFAFHVCDWRVPTRDFLNDRTLMGKGCIPLKTIRQWVDLAGFTGPIEVEIFSDEYWAMDQTRYLEMIRDAWLTQL